jgi:DNA-directed RNA polymerase specialized sigma24 family protein
LANKDFEDFTVSEMREIIAETILTDENRRIAELRYIKLLSYEQISEKVLIDKRTVQSRIKSINAKLNNTINKRK